MRLEKLKTKMVDEATKKTLAAIPLLKTKAGPRDKDLWVIRLKEEYSSLIKVSLMPFGHVLTNHSFFNVSINRNNDVLF